MTCGILTGTIWRFYKVGRETCNFDRCHTQCAHDHIDSITTHDCELCVYRSRIFARISAACGQRRSERRWRNPLLWPGGVASKHPWIYTRTRLFRYLAHRCLTRSSRNYEHVTAFRTMGGQSPAVRRSEAHSFFRNFRSIFRFLWPKPPARRAKKGFIL